MHIICLRLYKTSTFETMNYFKSATRFLHLGNQDSSFEKDTSLSTQVAISSIYGIDIFGKPDTYVIIC